MMQELCLVNDFTGMHGPAYGSRYLQDLINMRSSCHLAVKTFTRN